MLGWLEELVLRGCDLTVRKEINHHKDTKDTKKEKRVLAFAMPNVRIIW